MNKSLTEFVIKKIIISFFISILITFNILAQNNDPYGLELNSKESIEEERSSLILSSNQSIELENSFTISFDVSFRHSDYMGTILDVLDKDFHSKLNFIQFTNKDTAFLNLIINNKPTSLNYPLPKSLLNNNKWFNIKVYFNLLSNYIIFEIDQNKIKISGLTLKPKLNAKINFGLRKFYPTESPPMRIKNIRIFDSNNKKIHEWLLNETNGDIAHDNVGNINAKVYNPVWLLPKHYNWNLAAKFGPFDKSNLPKITYDSNNQRIIIVSKDNVYFYNTNKISISKINSKIPQKDFNAFYSNKWQKLYSQHGGQGKISTFDELKFEWEKIDTTGEHDRHYYGHNFFEDPLSGNLLMMNGYGWYKVKNHFQKYNFKENTWEIIKLSGDYLLPRTSAAVSSVDSTGSFYLFGGWGSYSGNQENGFTYLQDFYKIDLISKKVTKIWDKKFQQLNLFVTNSIVLDKMNNCFYVGAINLNTNPMAFKLFKFALDGSKYEIVGDSISTVQISEQYLTTPLIFDEKQQKFYLSSISEADKDSFYLMLYSINHVPINEKTFNYLKYKENKSITDYSFIYVLLIIVGTSVFLITIFKKRKLNFNKLSEKEINDNQINNQLDSKNELNKIISYKPNSVYLFGDFKVFDKNGIDITKEFSPKVKQLFLLLFLNSFYSHRNGINKEELSLILWGEYSNDQVKNNRNVTFSKLRKIFEKLNGIELKTQNNFYEIEIKDEFYSDFLEFLSLMNSNNFTIEKLEKIKSICERGECFYGFSYEWLDSLKTKFLENSINILLKLSKNHNNDFNFDSYIGEIILLLDSVNEDGLSIKIKSLNKEQKITAAKKTFNNFKKEYFRMFAEEYSKTFEEFLN